MSASERPTNWRKSSFSQNGDCIECAYDEGYVYIRDSKSSSGVTLKIAFSEWQVFITDIKTDEIGVNHGPSI